MTLTAATMKREVLDPALDAIALNLAQERICFDPSSDVDSLLEHINALATTDPCRASAMLALLTRLVAQNQLERQNERMIAGFGDRTTTELRHAQLNGDRPGVSLKQVVREARDPLDFFSKAQPRALEHAAALGRLVARVPSAQLLAPAVRHDLGRKRFELLEQYAAAVNDGAHGTALDQQVGPARGDAR